MNKLNIVLLVVTALIGCSKREAPVPLSVAPEPVYIPQPVSVPEPIYTPQPVSTPDPVIIQPSHKTTVTGKDFTVSEIATKMSKIDDIGLVFVRHADGSVVLAQSAAWKYGVSGSADSSLNQYLESGTNLVIFALYNHKAKKLIFNQSILSAWRFNFSLFGDGTAIFTNSNEGKADENGVMSWTAFNVENSGNGQFIVSKASDNQMAMLEPAFRQINADFLKHTISDDVADISSEIAVGIRTGVSGSN